MPWKETGPMSERVEFVKKAIEEGVNMSALCREYGISRKTAYKWIVRYVADGRAGLEDRSRRPHSSPNRTPETIERLVVEVRREHPCWGGRKNKRFLENQGHKNIPSPSTITSIFRRHELLDPEEALKHRAYQRFEREKPNELWQMDFKGHFTMSNGKECHPLTVLDDHSRFLIGLKSCANETETTVKGYLTNRFKLYGLPERMLMDNGSIWHDRQIRFTIFTVWLLRLGIPVSHGRFRHPQTQGKIERLHRSLKAELISPTTFDNLDDCQSGFDQWRELYNCQRPHEAHDLDVPDSHYQPSPRSFPETLSPLTFPLNAHIRKVDSSAKISFRGNPFRIGRAFVGQHVGLLYDEVNDGLVHVFFNQIPIRTLDLTVEC